MWKTYVLDANVEDVRVRYQLLLHQFSLRAHFQVSININKYIIESEARTVRRLTKSDIEKVSRVSSGKCHMKVMT